MCNQIPIKGNSADTRFGQCSNFRSALGAGVREKELLTVDFVARDCRLALGANQPIDEGLAFFGLYVGMLGGIDQDNAILVEELKG